MKIALTITLFPMDEYIFGIGDNRKIGKTVHHGYEGIQAHCIYSFYWFYFVKPAKRKDFYNDAVKHGKRNAFMEWNHLTEDNLQRWLTDENFYPSTEDI